jgi:3-oxoacyl-[acyl-carrier protein] reductase
VNSIAPSFMATSPDYEQQWNNWLPEFRENFVKNIAMRRIGVGHRRCSDVPDL